MNVHYAADMHYLSAVIGLMHKNCAITKMRTGYQIID